MKKLIFLLAMVALLSFSLLDSVAFGQEPPPGPTVKYRAMLEIPPPPGQFDLIQVVVDFPPGAWTPAHSHGGQAFSMVLAGEITLRENGSERKIKAGETWSDAAGVVHEAGNTGDAPARISALFLLPKGAQQTTPQGGAPVLAPTTLYQTKLEAAPLSGPFDVVQLALDFAPGAWTPVHSHGGQTLVTILEGEVTERHEGIETTYQPGESWTEQAGALHQAGNAGAEPASITAIFLLPKGAELTTVQQATPPATLPPTGEDGGHWLKVWFLLLAGGGLIVGGWLIFSGWFLRKKIIKL